MLSCCCSSIDRAYAEQLELYSGKDHPVMLLGLKGLVEPLLGTGNIFDNVDFSVRVAYFFHPGGRALGACRIPVGCSVCGAEPSLVIVHSNTIFLFMRFIMAAGMQFIDIQPEKVRVSAVVSPEVFEYIKTGVDMYTNRVPLDPAGVGEMFEGVWARGGLIRSHAYRIYRAAVAWLLFHEVMHAMTTPPLYEAIWNAVIVNKFGALPDADRLANWIEEFRADGIATFIMMGAIATHDNPSLVDPPASEPAKCAHVEPLQPDCELSADPMFYGRNVALLGALTALEVFQFCESYAYGVKFSHTMHRALKMAEFATHPPVQLRKEAMRAIGRLHGGIHDHLVDPWFGALWTLMGAYSDAYPVPE